MIIKVAIVGLGRIFPKHYESLLKYKNFKVICICDTNEKKKTEYSFLNVPFYKSMTQMLYENRVDLTIILTPTGYHADHFAKLSKYCKNFVIEKPIALTTLEVKKIKKYKRKYKNNIFVVKQNRFNKPIKIFENIFKKKLFGEIFYCDFSVKWRRTKEYYNLAKWRGTYKIDGGVIGNQGAHQLDLIIYFFGYPKKINVISKKINKRLEYPDMLLINFLYENNLVINFHITTASRPHNYDGSLLVMGKKGTMKIGGFQLNKIEYLKLLDLNEEKKINIKKYDENIRNVYGNGHIRFYKYICPFLKYNKEDVSAYNVAILTAKLIEKINKITKKNV
jgi:predicted dehydrogenase